MDASYIQGYANSITGIINGILVPTLISVAFIVFLWGIYNYFIKGADDEKKRAEGRVFTLYGIIGFVLLFSVWGIVQIFMGTLGLNSATNAPPFPTIGGSSGGDLTANGGACTSHPECASGYCSGGSLFDGICAQRPGGTSAAQTQMNNLYTSKNTTCTRYGSSSSQCISATTAYSNAQKVYVVPGGGGGGTITCGTFFKSVCAPGVTSCTIFGNCDDSTNTGGGDTGSGSGSGADCASGDGTEGALCCNDDYCDPSLACGATSSGVSRCGARTGSTNTGSSGSGTDTCAATGDEIIDCESIAGNKYDWSLCTCLTGYTVNDGSLGSTCGTGQYDICNTSLGLVCSGTPGTCITDTSSSNDSGASQAELDCKMINDGCTYDPSTGCDCSNTPVEN